LREAGGKTLDADSLADFDVDQIRLFRSHGAVNSITKLRRHLQNNQRGVANAGPAPTA
jgi:hypothetical protein